MSNIIRIKRRLPDSLLGPGAPAALSGGELAFNEIDNTLYYGASAGIIAIGGDGTFVNRTTNQTISGDKTFVHTTTLSSTNFNGTINAGSNFIVNLLDPVNNQDAATKKFVIDNIGGASNTLNSSVTALEEHVNTKFLRLTGGTITGDLTILGSLSALGDFTFLDTIVTTSSALSVINGGTGPALYVEQTGSNDIATFKDDSTVALIIKDGGNVGINTATPNERLTVSGNISASNNIYAGGSFEVVGATGCDTTLYVECGKVGVNTELPNEALTVSGNISGSNILFIKQIKGVEKVQFADSGEISNVYTLSGATDAQLYSFTIDCGYY